MKQIPLTNKYKREIFALVDDEDYEKLSVFTWNFYEHKNKTYAVRTDRSTGRQIPIRMHRVIMEVDDPKVLIDHMDRNGLNNQKSNLRKCSNKKNCANRKSHNNATSKYLGVYLRKDTNKWRVEGTSDGKRFNIGSFFDETEAAKAYDKWAKEYHGEFANLNFKTTE